MNKLLMKQVMMNRVLIALAPIVILSIFLFGWRVLAVVAIANIAAFVTEYLFIRQRKGGKVSMAVFVTGTLLALTLPPTIPFWIAIVGSVVAVSFGKMVFGGFGMNIFNPAIVGRTFIYISFPKAMQTTWLENWINFPGGFVSWMNTGQITSATPIATLAQPDIAPCWIKLFLGFIPGSIGETSALLIIFAGLYLITSKTAKWQPILATLASFALFSLLFYGGNPLPMMLSGGLMFGAVFMVTDPVSMPKRKDAIWIYGILVGFLTVFIRKYSLFPEGFMFALLLANTVMPIVEYGLGKMRSGTK